MDQLVTVPTLSIAELRKILSDNEVHDTSESKEDLQQLVLDTLLTKLMLNQLQDEGEKEYRESIETSRLLEQSRVSKELQEREHIRLDQEQEYDESVKQDLVDTQQEDTDPEEPEEPEDTAPEVMLSPRSLRQKRLIYYNQA